MTVVIQGRRQATEYLVPVNGEILWYGIASAVPTGFALDSAFANAYVMGAATSGATDTAAGSTSHTHTNPSATGTQASHTHTIGGGGTGAASGSDTVSNLYSIVYSAPTSHTHSAPSGVSSSAGGHSHTLSSTGIASTLPSYARLYWIQATIESPVPVGGIVMWDNPIAGSPTGFAICNGSGGTLDLRSCFIYGASTDGDLGATGGAASHTHTNPDSGSAGTHSHTLNLTSGGADSDKNLSGYTGGTTVAAGGHTHDLSATSNADADHTHTLSDTGTGSNNLPPYLRLYFIQRTS